MHSTRLVTVFALGALGCASGHFGGWGSYDGRFYADNGFVRLDTETFGVVFEGAPASHGGITSSFRVSGSGSSRVIGSVGGHRTAAILQGGVLTISVDQYTLTVTGGVATAGGQKFDVSGPWRTITIHADGSASSM